MTCMACRSFAIGIDGCLVYNHFQREMNEPNYYGGTNRDTAADELCNHYIRDRVV